ncbi:Trm112 family protein [Pelobacter propionicus]|uniref:Uncharacterized protein n=1 Tax=Pelobacter propionicus (strain DSM 2379 / NBRC 103807 / OttBd1) TaxID=338966 RepID=A1ATF6_PELPD|nr:Trm112 family protein [Pelobacter propionicus]ABL00627.1 protein of unknown function DUF343 [Pelobacter propionicus DSM 2379]
MLTNDLCTTLACPVCKGTLTLIVANEVLRCETCKLDYPVRNGIPVLLVDEATREPSHS